MRASGFGCLHRRRFCRILDNIHCSQGSTGTDCLPNVLDPGWTRPGFCDRDRGSQRTALRRAAIVICRPGPCVRDARFSRQPGCAGGSRNTRGGAGGTRCCPSNVFSVSRSGFHRFDAHQSGICPERSADGKRIVARHDSSGRRAQSCIFRGGARARATASRSSKRQRDGVSARRYLCGHNSLNRVDLGGSYLGGDAPPFPPRHCGSSPN